MAKEAFAQFWQRYPALLHGLAAFLGCSIGLHHHLCSWISVFFVVLSCLIVKNREIFTRLIFAIVLGISVFSFVKFSYQFPEISSQGLKGTAIVKIKSVSSIKKHYGKIWLYHGILESFIPDASSLTIAKEVPVTIALQNNENVIRPPATGSYQVSGTLRSHDSFHYSLQVAKTELWYPIMGTWSLAEWRFGLKQHLKKYLHRHIKNAQAVTFLQGIATGEFDDRVLSFEFSRFGLQHIMAISGFHFAIVASILSGTLRLFFSKRKSTCLLIFLLSSYFLFLGCSASIMRAWLAILIALCGFLIEKKTSGINALGAGLIFLILFDPLMSQNLGFQFSFATTASILLLFPTCDAGLQKLFAKRSLGQAVTMPIIDQHGYCLLVFLRQGLALTIAVNLIAMPITLFYFQKFPLMSLLYNLFFPFLVSFSMLLLLMALPFSFLIPAFANALHALNSAYTQFILNFTYHMPMTVDVCIRMNGFPAEWLIAYLIVIFSLGIFLKHYLEERQAEFRDFIFV